MREGVEFRNLVRPPTLPLPPKGPLPLPQGPQGEGRRCACLGGGRYVQGAYP
jgi:hypothetical protein